MKLTAEQRYRQAKVKTRMQDERACRAFMAGEGDSLDMSGERENLIAEMERLQAENEALRRERDGAMQVIETCEDSVAKLERKVQHWQERAEAALAQSDAAGGE